MIFGDDDGGGGAASQKDRGRGGGRLMTESNTQGAFRGVRIGAGRHDRSDHHAHVLNVLDHRSFRDLVRRAAHPHPSGHQRTQIRQVGCCWGRASERTRIAVATGRGSPRTAARGQRRQHPLPTISQLCRRIFASESTSVCAGGNGLNGCIRDAPV